MNNQLGKIVGQAVSAIDIVTGNEALDDELAKMYIPDCFAEKFAELIVRECADRIVNTLLADLEGPDPDDVLWLAAKQVKEHFGVEE
jgi:hypothetical protein